MFRVVLGRYCLENFGCEVFVPKLLNLENEFYKSKTANKFYHGFCPCAATHRVGVERGGKGSEL